MAKIYVASSWRNEHQPQVVRILSAMGHDVYDFKNPPGKTGFAWSSISKQWENWSFTDYKAALETRLAKDGFNSDFEAMLRADLCVLVLPCGRSAHAEAGWFAGAGKPVIAMINEHQEPELMYKMFTEIVNSDNAMLNAVEKLFPANSQEKTLAGGMDEIIMRAPRNGEAIHFGIEGVMEDLVNMVFSSMQNNPDFYQIVETALCEYYVKNQISTDHFKKVAVVHAMSRMVEMMGGRKTNAKKQTNNE